MIGTIVGQRFCFRGYFRARIMFYMRKVAMVQSQLDLIRDC